MEPQGPPPFPQEEKPRELGASFLGVLCLPLVVLGLLLADPQSASSGLLKLYIVSGIVCSIVCGVMVRRNTKNPAAARLGCLVAGGLVLFYGAAFFAGCMYGLSHMIH
jgi:hypothetical protein